MKIREKQGLLLFIFGGHLFVTPMVMRMALQILETSRSFELPLLLLEGLGWILLGIGTGMFFFSGEDEK